MKKSLKSDKGEKFTMNGWKSGKIMARVRGGGGGLFGRKLCPSQSLYCQVELRQIQIATGLCTNFGLSCFCFNFCQK